MTTTPASPAAPQPTTVDAAPLILKSMGLTLEDLAAPGQRPDVPTFADYVPVVSAAVTDGTRKAYGSYWNRVVEQWGARRLDEPTPSEIRQLVAYVKTHAVPRHNARGGRGAAENLIAAALPVPARRGRRSSQPRTDRRSWTNRSRATGGPPRRAVRGPARPESAGPDPRQALPAGPDQDTAWA